MAEVQNYTTCSLAKLRQWVGF